MAEDDHRRREGDCRQRLPVQQPGAEVGRHRAPHPRPPGAPASSRPVNEDDAYGRRGQCEHHERHERAHGRRQHEEDGDRQQDLHDLPGGALPGDDPQAAADVVHVAPVADPAMDVPDDAAGEREVEEQRSVVGRDGGGQREVDAEAAGNGRPPPCTADGGEEADGRRRQKSAAVDRAHAVEERAGAETPDDDGERGRRGRETRPPGDSPHGSTNRSTWPTVTASRPASASLRRRRR